jgi:hypothetical protein
MDQKSDKPNNNIKESITKAKTKTKYKPQFLNSVKNIDLDL